MHKTMWLIWDGHGFHAIYTFSQRNKMPEPTSEWGRDYATRTEILERHLLVLTTRITTASYMLTGVAALLVAVAGYFFISISELKSSVAVLQSTGNKISEDTARDRETREKLRESVARLDAIVERLDKTTTPPPAPSPSKTP